MLDEGGVGALGVNAALVGLFVMLVLHAAGFLRHTHGVRNGKSSIPGVRWFSKSWSELTTDELYRILKLRSEVFVVEQKCIFLDIDWVFQRTCLGQT